MCATKDDVKDCVDIELSVVQVCDTEDNKEYIVSTCTVLLLKFRFCHFLDVTSHS